VAEMTAVRLTCRDLLSELAETDVVHAACCDVMLRLFIDLRYLRYWRGSKLF